MKYIQSFWSKPIFEQGFNKSLGGWRDLKYFYMSWALSCLSIKKIYKEVELITDKKGYQILINNLGLPYTNVKVELDELNHYPAKLWAIGKLYAYNIQKEPFIHLDGDVYLWSEFEAELINSGIVAQQEDIDNGHYSKALLEIRNNNFHLPHIIENDLKKFSEMKSINAGIIGGNDITFFHDFCEEAFKFIDSNMKKYNEELSGTSYAIMYEQFLLSCLARKEKKEISYYFNFDLNQKKDFFVEDVSDFINKYGRNKYVHLLSENKKQPSSCYELQNQLRLEFPDYYKKIINLFSQNWYKN